MEMVALNSQLEAETVDRATLRAAAERLEASTEGCWANVIWRLDAREEITARCTLNEMHLRLLLVARL